MQLEYRSRLRAWSRLAALIAMLCLLSDFAALRRNLMNRKQA